MERKYIKADVGVVVGRFQVPELHDGHVELLDWVCKKHQKVIIVLGIAVAHGTRENPLDFQSRSQMIVENYPNVIILPLVDTKYDNLWSFTLDNLIASCINPSQSVVLYGSRDSFLKHYLGKYPTQELVGDSTIWSGTKVREQTKIETINSVDFRKGAIWQSYNRYANIFPTVDIVIYDKYNNQLLLARKSTDENNKWRFVGGFSDVRSQSYEDDAIREVKEETNLDVNIRAYLGSTIINDWRYRGVDQIKTLLFLADLQTQSNNLKAQDDIENVKWFYLDDMCEDIFVDEHKKLFKIFKDCLTKYPKMLRG